MADDRLVWKFNCPQQVASIKSHRDGAGRDESLQQKCSGSFKNITHRRSSCNHVGRKDSHGEGKENRVDGSPETAGGAHGHL